MKTRELTGPALDWAVAKCEGYVLVFFDDFFLRTARGGGISEIRADHMLQFQPYRGQWVRLNSIGGAAALEKYSTDWAQGGPIIERELIRIISPTIKGIDWVARIKCGMVGTAHEWLEGYGPAPLIAAMRCYVASKLGDEVEIPEELK